MSCDIVIPVWNKKELTSECIEHVVANTHYPYRIIAVDDASDSPTKEYLESLKEDKRFKFKLIRNEKNLGNTKTGNQGMLASDADFVCVLDNDTVVTDGWLSEMVAVANLSQDIGVVNPSLRDKPKDTSLKGIIACAQECKRLKERFTETAAAIGFCFLVKHKVVEEIGVWDEEFSPGYFEDTEYSLRARKAGYRVLIAQRAYVFHKEHVSFKDRNFEQLFKRSREVFYRKVGKPKRILYILTKENKEYFESLKKETLDYANQYSWVRVFLKASLASLKLARHANIQSITISSLFFRLHSVFNVLVKKKKYTHIFVDDSKLFNLLNKLRRIHKAEVALVK